MKTLDLRKNPDLQIPRLSAGDTEIGSVRKILQEVRERGDRGLIDLTERLDGVVLDADKLRVPFSELKAAHNSSPKELIAAIEEAAARLGEFCERQRLRPWSASIGGGTLGESIHPVEVAGFYAPGGKAAYPSVVVMCAVPASVAGVDRKVLCVPPASDGGVPRPVLAAAHICGIDEVYRVGGAQAIGAMAFGTETVPKVDVIAGGGGLWVALAKREVAGMVGIDSVAGPSEIAIVADRSADPGLLAADLIAQAEHGPHGAFVLVSWDEELIGTVESALEKRLERSHASAELRAALEAGSVAALVDDLDHAVDAVSKFAPEHLELICDGADEIASRVRNAGAVFVGPYSPVSLGDYLAGSNHTLPTMGAARWASGLRVSLFQRATAVVKHDSESLATALPHIRALAEAEGLPNHARAVEARFEQERLD